MTARLALPVLATDAMFMRVVPVLRQAVKLLWDGFTPHSPEHHKISITDDDCPE